jgi:hypothetical protein
VPRGAALLDACPSDGGVVILTITGTGFTNAAPVNVCRADSATITSTSIVCRLAANTAGSTVAVAVDALTVPFQLAFAPLCGTYVFHVYSISMLFDVISM